MIFKARALRPKQTDWKEIEGEDPQWIAGEYQIRFGPPSLLARRVEVDGRGIKRVEHIRFCVVEVEGFGEFISRYFSTGIFRRGGLKPPGLGELQNIANILRWDDHPDRLLDNGWDHEEGYDRSKAALSIKTA